MGNVFEGIENAEVQRDSEFIRPGRYILRLDACRTGVTRKQIDYSLFSFTCVDVVDDTAASDDPKGPHRVGDKVSWMIMKSWDGFLAAVKSAIVQMTGCSEDEVTSDNLQIIFGGDQPLAGNFYEVDARNIITKKNTTFTKVRVVRELAADEVRARVPDHVATSGLLG